MKPDSNRALASARIHHATKFCRLTTQIELHYVQGVVLQAHDYLALPWKVNGSKVPRLSGKVT